MISEDLHFTHMWKTLTYLHHITKRGGCWPIKRVLPRHFSLKCLYQARGMSGHVLSIMTVSTIFHFGFDSVAFCVYYLIPNAGMRAWSQTHNHDRAFHWRVQYMFGILSQQSWKLLLCSKTKYKLPKMFSHFTYLICTSSVCSSSMRVCIIFQSFCLLRRFSLL